MEAIIEFAGKILGKLFGTQNERMLRRYWRIVKESINPLEANFKDLNPEEFPKKTEEFRKRFFDGEALEEILPEAFALCREASRRTTGMRHFDVQLIGGIVLHEGKIAEMATGEGKTLVATLAAYLNALGGKGVHVVTVYDYLGLTVGCIQHEEAYIFDRNYKPDPKERMHNLRPCPRKEAYLADITYGTNNEFGFDYLRDNMKVSLEDQVQRGHHYAIVDEVDSILIDEARTPLIISGPAEEAVDKYYLADRVARRLKKGLDYEVKEKEHIVILTERGIDRAQEIVGVDNFYTGENMDWPHYIEQALKAHNLYRLDRDYVIKDGEVVIVDEFTGRLMPGRRWSDGLHQAIEAKEGMRIQEENQTLATITLQNYFKLYEKLAGMTGTAATEATEFEKIYKLEVVVIPTNRPLIRYTYPDVIYGTEKEKFDAVEEAIAQIHSTGRPILVGTTSIEKSEMLSERLRMRGIKHEVLNAKHHEREAQIIAKAGQRGGVTISTNMAGRGTDILLGEGVAQIGGLHVIGTERHEARRIDNQLRGRAGRQGDPGSSQFFLSLEDDLFRKFAPPWVRSALVSLGLSNGQAIQSRMISKAIERAQKNVESHNFEIRKNLLEYDQVMNEQRKYIYSMRQKILAGEDTKGVVIEMIKNRIRDGVERFLPRKLARSEWDYQGLILWFLAKFGIQLHIEDVDRKDPDGVEEFFIKKVEEFYERHEAALGKEELRAIEKYILLDKIDEKWKDHLYNMDQIKADIGLRGYGQLDPKLEYKREAVDLFESMMISIEEDVSELIFKLQKVIKKERLSKRWRVTNYRKDEYTSYGEEPLEGVPEEKPRPIIVGQKTPRNAPCPCGSGKKYKRCCGR